MNPVDKGPGPDREIAPTGRGDPSVKEALSAMANETGNQTRAVVEPTTIEVDPPGFLSLTESEALLREHSVDLKLGEARDDEVRSMIRWGLLDKSNADKYGANLDDIRMPKYRLQEFIHHLSINPGTKVRIILGEDTMPPHIAFQKLIIDAGIRHEIVAGQCDSPGFLGFARLDLATTQPLRNLPTGKAGILFTPDDCSLPNDLYLVGADNVLQNMANKNEYVGPVGWMKLFRQSLDRALPILFPEEAKDIYNLSPGEYKALLERAMLDERIAEYLQLDCTEFADWRDITAMDNTSDESVYNPMSHYNAVPTLEFDICARPPVIVLSSNYVDPDLGYEGPCSRPAFGTFVS